MSSSSVRQLPPAKRAAERPTRKTVGATIYGTTKNVACLDPIEKGQINAVRCPRLPTVDITRVTSALYQSHYKRALPDIQALFRLLYSSIIFTTH
jgi:hypothetical protein